jgi:type II secretory pathway pseudopilin PulG
VVIAIISILASLLLPALEAAVEAGRNVRCVNNLRQQGMTQMTYANDFRGSPIANYLTPNELPSTKGRTWFKRLAERHYIEDYWPREMLPAAAGGEILSAPDGSGMNGWFVSNPVANRADSVFACPSHPGEAGAGTIGSYLRLATADMPAGGATFRNLSTSYHLNEWVTIPETKPGIWGHYAAGAQPWGWYTFDDIGGTGEGSKVMLLYCSPGVTGNPCGNYERRVALSVPWRDQDLNAIHGDHWNALHYDLSTRAYHRSAHGASKRVYPFFPRRRGNTDKRPVRMSPYDRNITMTELF